MGASGGSLTVWNGNKFDGEAIFQNDFAQSAQFTSLHSGDSWVLTNIYALCTDEGRVLFLDWFKNIMMPEDID